MSTFLQNLIRRSMAAAVCVLIAQPLLAQLPQCDRIYMDRLDGWALNNTLQIWTYNPTVPVSGTNPSQNTITLPTGANGLTVSEVLGSGNTTLTFYTVKNNQYWYYNPTTSVWTNTGHGTGNTAAVNIAAGGGFIYNLVGATGQVYKYNGTATGTLLVTVPNQNGVGPYDLLADCEGNFYILRGTPTTNRILRKYSPAGVLLQTWTVNAPNDFWPSGGFGIINGNVYTDQVTGFLTYNLQIANGPLGTTQVNIGPYSAPVPFNGDIVGDMGSCASAVTITPDITIATPQTSLCAGTPVTFTSTSVGGGPGPTYQWFVNGNPVPGATSTTYTYIPQNGDVVTAQMVSNAACVLVPLDTSNAITMTIFPPVTNSITASACNGTYYIFSNGDTLTTSGVYIDTLSTSNGCDSIVTLNLTVMQPLPAPGVNDLTVCQGSGNVTLTASGQNLTWYDAPTGGSVIPGPVAVPTTNPGSTTYYVSQTIGGCESPRAALTVNITLRPTASLTGATAICIEDTLWVGYNGNGTTSMDYTWTVTPNALDYSQAVGIGPASFHFAQPGNYTVGLVVTNAGCSSPQATLPVQVTQPPRPFFTLPEHGCIGHRQNLVYDFVNDQTISYNWNLDGGTAIFGDQGQPIGVVFDQPGTYHITLQTVQNGCFSPVREQTIQIHPFPRAEILTNPGMLCEGDTVRFTAAATDETSKFYWGPLSWNPSSIDPYTALIQVPHSGEITLQVINQYGCSASDTLPVQAQLCCQVEMPSAFTPNGDGRNDIFRPFVVGEQTVAQFRIVNRWGKVVYYSTDKAAGWDGTYKGEPQKMDTYFYFLEYFCSDGNRHEIKGDVTLIR